MRALAGKTGFGAIAVFLGVALNGGQVKQATMDPFKAYGWPG